MTDYILLNRVDDQVDNTILTFYAGLATASLIFFYAGIAKRFGDRFSVIVERYAGGLMQYASGGLFSGMLIFYGRSGSLLSSWPFLLFIISAILGNELIKNRGRQLVFNLYAYFIGIFSFVVLQVPVITGKMGGLVFVASSVGALVIVYIVVQILTLLIPNYLQMEMRKIVFVILSTFALLMTLYFTNVLPPIPLSLSEITIAQSVTKVGNDYEVVYEPAPWWQFWRLAHETFNPGATHSVACFTRVFAPTKLTTDIYHVWEYKDKNGNWTEHFKLKYQVAGSDGKGYRGYTAISSYHDGVWRCRVETARGQVIGQQVFTIDSSVAPTQTERRVE